MDRECRIACLLFLCVFMFLFVWIHMYENDVVLLLFVDIYAKPFFDALKPHRMTPPRLAVAVTRLRTILL